MCGRDFVLYFNNSLRTHEMPYNTFAPLHSKLALTPIQMDTDLSNETPEHPRSDRVIQDEMSRMVKNAIINPILQRSQNSNHAEHMSRPQDCPDKTISLYNDNRPK